MRIVCGIFGGESLSYGHLDMTANCVGLVGINSCDCHLRRLVMRSLAMSYVFLARPCWDDISTSRLSFLYLD